ncbi:MAG: hypothetical protein H6869_08685 [Rhodospirillales bacterium]|nr:hypothetical protein [Rhodospirillales bacterium]
MPAYAQSNVAVRTGVHGSYTRAVFDWPKAVKYTVSKPSEDEILVRFESDASLAFGATEHGANGVIRNISQVSGAGVPLEVLFKTSAGATYRDFLVGSRLVLDVSAPEGTAEQKHEAVAQTQAPVPLPPAKKALPPADHEGPAVEAVKPEPVEAVEIDAEPEQTIVEQAAPILEPHVITVSATEAVGLAVFRRYDWLWLVMDRSSVNIPPQIAGEQADRFGPFERVELKGAVAYRAKLPPGHKNMHIYGEGGGLVWRIVITPNERDSKPVEPKRNFNKDQLVRGGTLTWPLSTSTRIIDVADPSIGDTLKVITVEQADQFAGPARDMVDVNVIESFIGLALNPRLDDVTVKLTRGEVEIERPGGLALSRIKDVSRRLIRQEVQDVSVVDNPVDPEENIRLIFDFDRWMMGGLQALEENQRIMLSAMAVKDKNGQVQDLLTLAKMNVSNDRGQEAVGFLSYAAAELPDIADSPEFKALRGAAAALAGKYEIAFKDLFHPSLADYTELDYWRAYTLSSLEDWQQAMDIMPDDFTVLVGYPKALLEKLGIKLAEVALRSGDVQTTEGILAVLQRDRNTLKPWTTAAMDYLKGEAHRQSKEYESARNLWEPLIIGKDDLYRAKAGLALTMLELEVGDIDTPQAIDRLEGLRYAWRGDELEARINMILGKFYLEQDRYLKGFNILREATSMSPDSDISKEITTYMQQEFRDLLLNDNDLSPLDAVQVYEEFRELTPTGDEGNRLVQKLAERLVEADLLARAAAILEHQVDYRLKDEEKARVSVRLGAVLLLDKNARKAMKYLAIGRDLYGKVLTGEARTKKLKEIDLMRARGLSQLNRTEEAIELLNGFDPDPTVNRLRADIAWQAGLWEDAAEALQDLILDQALDLNRPLTATQADLLLHRAVALNLSGNRVALTNMRRKYEDAMKKTARARLFDVVTRPRKTSILADRETIEGIVQEVDMFEEFLKSYKQDAEAVSN